MIAFAPTVIAPPADESAVRDYLARVVTLPPDVERLVIELGNDAMGDPAVWVWVIVHDQAAQNSVLLDKIERSLYDALFVRGSNLQPYISFRASSEQRDIESGVYDDEYGDFE